MTNPQAAASISGLAEASVRALHRPRRCFRAGRLARLAALAALTTACGGGGDGQGPTYSIGGTVTGLASGTSFQIANGGDSLSISTIGAFTFSTKLPSQRTYAVTVSQQPVGQVCNVGNGSGTVASSNVINIAIACVKSLPGGTGTVAASGGMVSTPVADVTVPSGASLKPQTITVTPMVPPPGLPLMLTAIGAAIDVAVDQPDALNAPFLITLRYDASAVVDEDQLAVVHYDAGNQRYEPVTIVSQDKAAHSFQVEARSFSHFLVVAFNTASLPTSRSLSNFSPSASGWNIPNFGSYYSPGGNSLGMSAYASWYFANRPGSNLGTKYAAAGNAGIAQLVAARAQVAQSQYWAMKSSTVLGALGNAATARLMKVYLAAFNQPMVLLLGQNGIPKHAAVLHGYDSTGFRFHDVDVMGAEQTLAFDGTNWGRYAGYDSFSYVALPSLGRNEDFATLTTQAEGGFGSSPLIGLTSPSPGQQIPNRSVALAGNLSGSLGTNASIVAYVKGVPQRVAVASGAFSATIPVSAGDNTVVVVAGPGLAQQSNWYANAATLIVDVTGTGSLTKLLTTLTWDQDNADVDLYVTEPPPGNQTSWYFNRKTVNRMNLDFDNTRGFGPEHTTLATVGTNAGTALAGQYPVAVHYYSDHGTGQTATGTVTIMLNEGQPNQQLVSKNFSIATSNSKNDDPGRTGPDWVRIGTVDLEAGTIKLAP
ncbi:hypothetical protein QTI66_02430 [Variovorax sp. J22R133]|uniref:YfaP family protein n=1 Tax=Variovorax brevis TaxID=3053503 RepID=UPI00257723D9|nr:hypothetical protein [Variovorax sp. J22R133]MDM0110983.1 hypothetical protein [Variovorax sp. J22R133]